LCSRTLPVSGNTSTPTPIEEKRGRGDLSATSNSKAPWKLAESARGVSPRAAHRTVLEALTSHGSCPSIKAAAFRRSDEFLRFPVDPAIAPRGTRPLRSSPITGPSSLLRDGPPQPLASVLSPHGFRPLVLLPWHPRPGSRSSTQKPVSDSRPLYAGRHLPRNQVPDRLVPAESSASGFGDIYAFRRVIKGSLTFVSRIRTCPDVLRTFDPTLTTTPFERSSLDWFGAGS